MIASLATYSYFDSQDLCGGSACRCEVGEARGPKGKGRTRDQGTGEWGKVWNALDGVVDSRPGYA